MPWPTLERDRAAGIASVATWLGPERAWAVGLWLHAVVVAMAIGSLSLAGAADTHDRGRGGGVRASCSPASG